MRTLKKTLCLVLCLAMMAGLCVIGTSAAFTDADEITYKEAVDVLTGIGVIDGMEDGSFAPTATLTRAQACKIVACLLGDGDIVATSKFVDVQGHWAESYVAYCAANGIVDGVSETEFAPEATLTGAAWGKMLLCAVGYDADECKMTGDAWEVGVASMLKTTKLAKNVKGFDATVAVSRDAACEMAFAAMKVSVTGETVYVVDGITDLVFEDFLTAFIAAGTDATKVHMDAPKDSILATVYPTLKTAIGNSDLGVAGYTWYVDANKNSTMDKDEAVSEFITTDTVVASYVKGAKIKEAVAAAGKKTTESLSVDLVVNGNAWTSATWAGNSTSDLLPDSNCTVTLVKTAAGAYKALYEYTALYKVTSITKLTGDDKGKANFTFTKQGGVDTAFASFVPATVTVKEAVDTYTLDTMYMGVPASATKFISVVAADAPATGKVTATAATYVKVGDTKYTPANANVTMPTNNETKVFYLNAAGDVMYVAAPSTVATVYDGYVYVTAAEYKATAGSLTGVVEGGKDATIVAKANIVTEAGEATTVDLTTKIVAATATTPSKAQVWDGSAFVDATADNAAHTAFAAGWYAYVAAEDGTCKLTAIAGLEVALAGVTAKQAAITVDSVACFMTKDTVIKTVNYDATGKKMTTTTITGYDKVTDADVLNGKNAIVVANDDGVVSEITIRTATTPAVATKYAVYAGLGENDAVKGQYYNFYVDGAVVSFLSEGTTVADASLTVGDVAAYEVTNGKVSSCTKKTATGSAAVIAQVQDGYVVIGTTIVYTASAVTVVDATATVPTYAVTNLAVGDTINYYAGTTGIEFAVVTAHAA